MLKINILIEFTNSYMLFLWFIRIIIHDYDVAGRKSRTKNILHILKKFFYQLSILMQYILSLHPTG